MNSSISSSEPPAAAGDTPDRPDRWRRFFWLAVAAIAGLSLFVYAFLVIVDPFDALFLSPRLDRTPVATNARYSFPALARDPKFDSAIFGTSTSRELQPAVLDPLFGARFVNLSMNSATAYEQFRLLELFARHHPAAKYVLIGLDAAWCETTATYHRLTPRPFPEWLYDGDRWRPFAEMFNLYTIEQAGRQFAVLTGMRPPFYGRDGYTNFLPPESAYDLARVRFHLYGSRDGRAPPPAPAPPALDDVARQALVFPPLALLRQALAKLPAGTRKLLYFVPYHVAGQARPGSEAGSIWRTCKDRVAAIAAAAPDTNAIDFMIDSSITRQDSNYWDRLHYRVGVGVRLAHDLAQAELGDFPAADPDFIRLR